MKCHIIAFAVSDPGNHGMGRAAFRCEAHNWQVDGPVGAGDLCPIGRIEQATEEALKMLSDAALLASRPVFVDKPEKAE